MSIALHDLAGDGIRLEPELGAHILFDFRTEVSERPHRAGQFADRDIFAHRPQALAMAAHLLIPDRHLEAE